MSLKKTLLVLALLVTFVNIASFVTAEIHSCGTNTGCWQACESYCTYGCDSVSSSLNCESPYCSYDCKTASQADTGDDTTYDQEQGGMCQYDSDCGYGEVCVDNYCVEEREDQRDTCQGTCDYEFYFSYQQPTAPQTGIFNLGASKCGNPVNAEVDISGEENWQGWLGNDGKRSVEVRKGSYHIRASYQGDTLSQDTYLSCSETEDVIFNFPSTQQLTIKVVNEQGRPLDAFVKLRGRSKDWEGNLGSNGKVTLTIPAEDYDVFANYQGQLKNKEVSLGCDQSQTITFTYQTEEVCENPSLTVSTKDQHGNGVDARVSITGPKDKTFYTGYNGQRTVELKPGDYQVKAEYQGQSRTKHISLDCGDQRRVDFTFGVCDDGKLIIKTKEQKGNNVNAYVTVNGPDGWSGKVGHDGYKSLTAGSGNYDIRADYEGQSRSRHVYLGCGATKREVFTFHLEAPPTCDKASLTIRASDQDGTSVAADIKIRGPESRNFNLGSSGFRTVKLEAGNYDVTAQYEGRSRSKHINLDCGESRQTEFFFRSCAPATLTVRTTDQSGNLVNAHVQVRGPEDRSFQTGAGGLRSIDLKAGSYDVITNYNGKSRSHHIELGCGEKRRVIASFTECEDSTLTVKTTNHKGEGVNAYVKISGPRHRVFYIGEGGLRTLSLPAGDYDITSKYEGETKSEHICLGCGSEQICGISRQLEFMFRVDNQAPGISRLRPSGEIDCEEDVSLSVKTDEWATCAYSEQPFAFASGISFAQTQGTYHTTHVSAEPGQEYDYYLKCQDREDNVNQQAARIHFSCQEEETRPAERQQQGNLKVIVRDEEERVKNARVSVEKVQGIVERVRYTNFAGKATFARLPAGLYVARATKEGYETGSNGNFVKKGNTSIIHIELGREKVDLSVIVRGEKGERLQGARVRVRGVDTDSYGSRWTDSFGRAHFSNLERGNYDIKIRHEDYKSLMDSIHLIRTDERSYALSKEEEAEEEEEEAKGDQLEIKSIIFPDKVDACSQQQLQVKVKNTDSETQEVKLKVKVLGKTYSSRTSHVLARGQAKRFEIPLSIPAQAGGAETLQIIATSDENQVSTALSFQVREVHATIKVNPSSLTIGQQVQVYGFLSSSNRRAQIYLNGEKMASVRSDSSGYYQTYLRTYRSGKTSVELRLDCGQTIARKQLTVRPNITLDLTQWREKVQVGERFEVCAEAQAQYGAMVYLVKDGNTIRSRKMRSNEERVCFETSLSKGIHQLAFKLDSIKKGRSVTAIEPKTEVKVFPKNLQMGLGGTGMMRVRLCNSGLSAKTYRVGVSGLDPNWVSSPVDEITLQSGECKDIFLHFNPHEMGSHHGSVRVMSNGDCIGEEFIKLYVTSQSGLGENLIGRIYGIFHTYLIYILAIVMLVGTGYSLYRSFLTSDSLEPRYQ